MFPWGRLATRIFILLLICIALWIGRDPLVKYSLIQSAQAKLGAKVEIGKVRTSFREGKLYLTDVAIADPREPMKNMVQAESIALNLNVKGLINRRFEVVSGTTAQLVFNAPRSNSGRLDITPPLASDPLVNVVNGNLSQQTQVTPANPVYPHEWLEDLRMAGRLPGNPKLELSRTAADLFQRLDSELHSQVSQIDELKTTIRKMHDVVNFDGNILRNQTKWQDAQNQLSDLQVDIETMVRRLNGLDQQISTERENLILAKEKDAQNLNRRKKLDGESLNQLLLTQTQVDQARNIVDWYLSFRETFPDAKFDFQQGPRVGKNLCVPGIGTTPSFLIDNLQLDGEGRFAGVKFNFTGSVSNFATEPQLSSQPVKFNLRAQGNTHFTVEGTLDRRHEHPYDNVVIRCADFPVPEQVLGTPDSMQVMVSPSRSQIEVNLQVDGDQVKGQLNFNYDNLVMQIKSLPEEAGGQDVIDRINLDLASITSYQVSAEIVGPAARPTVAFNSDLGKRFIGKFDELFENKMQVARNMLDQELDKHLALLEGKYSEKIRVASNRLEDEILSQRERIVADLRNRMPNDPLDRSLRR